MCGKSSGFADFENTVDRWSAVNFHADSGLCLSYVRTLGPKRNLDRWSFFSLGRYVNYFIQITSFFDRSFELKCEPAIGIVLRSSHQACCLLHIWAKLTVVFTCTSLPLNLKTSVFGWGCGFGFEQKSWRIDGFGEKEARIGGFAYPYSPPLRNKSYRWFFFETFPECSLPSSVSKNAIKMIGHHSRLRDVTGRSYLICACTPANHAGYSSVHDTFCGSSKHSL